MYAMTRFEKGTTISVIIEGFHQEGNYVVKRIHISKDGFFNDFIDSRIKQIEQLVREIEESETSAPIEEILNVEDLKTACVSCGRQHQHMASVTIGQCILNICYNCFKHSGIELSADHKVDVKYTGQTMFVDKLRARDSTQYRIFPKGRRWT